LAAYQPPSFRVALGLGDQELEQRLRPGLDAAEDLSIIAQCLAADQLLGIIETDRPDAVVISWSLHRLTDPLLDQVERPGLVVVLLVADPHDDRWRRRRGPVLPTDTDAATLRQVLASARTGARVMTRGRAPAQEPLVLKPADSPQPATGGILAVTGGAGSPGRTTVAMNVSAALGTAAPTVLVELDLCAPSLAAYLDRDPSRNICTLAHSVRDDPRAWRSALHDELQPLGPAGSQTLVLCGPPKREMRSSLAPGFVEQLIGELSRRYRWVVLDVGPELLGIDAPASVHRAALAAAQRVLLVSGSDLVGLWHARVALDMLERQVGVDRGSINLILSRHDARFHHTPAEVEWHLGVPVVGVVPFDQSAAQRAVLHQRVLVSDPGGRASRALIAVAEHLNEGKLRMPVESVPRASPRQAWWKRVVPLKRMLPPARRPMLIERAALAAAPDRGRSRAW
jgi:Flp pilus assembly CpaE family ATPase